jgi:predicted nucleic acid-binding protein
VTWLLDTNVISELSRHQPDPGVLQWLEDVDEDQVFLSVVTITEVRYSAERLPLGRRRNRLEQWIQTDLRSRFEDRLLPIDAVVAERAGQVLAKTQAIGVSAGPMDAFIAATALVHDLALVTRNVKEFSALGLRLLNPWDSR